MPPPTTRTYHAATFAAQTLSHLLSDPSLSDVTITTTDAQTFPCHRAVLSASSPVFRAMFLSPMSESATGRVSLPIAAAVFAPIRRFLYGHPLHVAPSHALPTSVFVRAYQVHHPALAHFLDTLLASALSMQNLFLIRRHAVDHHAHALLRACDRFLVARMPVLHRTPPFLAASLDDVLAALRAHPNVSDAVARPRVAQHALAAALAWLAADPARAPTTDRVLDAVDVDRLSLGALVRATREPLALASAPFQKRLLRAFARRADRDLAYAAAPPPDPPASATDHPTEHYAWIRRSPPRRPPIVSDRPDGDREGQGDAHAQSADVSVDDTDG